MQAAATSSSASDASSVSSSCVSCVALGLTAHACGGAAATRRHRPHGVRIDGQSFAAFREERARALLTARRALETTESRPPVIWAWLKARSLTLEMGKQEIILPALVGPERGARGRRCEAPRQRSRPPFASGC